jgi:hypothetical protein
VALVSAWIPLPPTPVLVDPAEPYLVPEERFSQLIDYVTSVQAEIVEVDISAAVNVADVVSALKDVLPFPDWCGLSWDSMEDAFEELRQAWRFPLVLVVRGVQVLIGRRPHLGLEVVLRLSGLSRAFSIAGDQLLVTHVWRTA